MPETKFTPGPWEADTMATYVFAGIMMVCQVRGWGYLIGSGGMGLDENAAIEVQRANARLIAAAPDLLDALKQLYFDNEIPVRNGHFERVTAALAKALGERATTNEQK